MIAYLKKIDAFLKELDNAAQAQLNDCSSIISFKKGDYLLRKGQICMQSFIVQTGIARKYFVVGDKELTTEFYFESDVAISFESYVMQIPSNEHIQAITDITVSAMDYDAFQKAKAQHPQLRELDTMMGDYYTVWLEKRLFHFHTLNATERYQLLLANQPALIQNVPLTFIASYLGVSLETLSRIRAKI
jgi:CRP-like cAMP-binding protein